jgi:hypothetical protein
VNIDSHDKMALTVSIGLSSRGTWRIGSKLTYQYTMMLGDSRKNIK